MVETANRDIHLVCVWCGHERQGRAAGRTKRAQPRCPRKNSGLALREAKLSPPKRGPCYERRAATSTTIRAMTVRDVVRLPGRLVTHRSTQAAALKDVCGHIVSCGWAEGIVESLSYPSRLLEGVR